MKTVGIRELKNRLSEYIRHVQSGQPVLVTDRGTIVAELTLPGQGVADSGVPPGLLALSKRGLLTVGAPTSGEIYPAFRRTRRRHRAVDLLDEERGSR